MIQTEEARCLHFLCLMHYEVYLIETFANGSIAEDSGKRK